MSGQNIRKALYKNSPFTISHLHGVSLHLLLYSITSFPHALPTYMCLLHIGCVDWVQEFLNVLLSWAGQSHASLESLHGLPELP